MNITGNCLCKSTDFGSLSHHLGVIWFPDIVHLDIPKYLMTVTKLNRHLLKLALRHCDLTLNSLHFAARFNQMNWCSFISEIFKIEANPYSVSCRATKVTIQLHSLAPKFLQNQKLMQEVPYFELHQSQHEYHFSHSVLS